MILSYIISSNRKHTRCSTISHDYSVTWLQFDQSDSFKLVRFNQWRFSIVMWFGHSWYSIYTVRSVHFRMLLISHKYNFSFSELIKNNVLRHDTLFTIILALCYKALQLRRGSTDSFFSLGRKPIQFRLAYITGCWVAEGETSNSNDKGPVLCWGGMLEWIKKGSLKRPNSALGTLSLQGTRPKKSGFELKPKVCLR